MLKRDGGKQLKMTFLTLEELMPEKHFLRDLERCVDFGFIYDVVEPLYAKIGRPSVDPVLLVKMLLLGYLYGIPSERKLEQEIRVNIAFRWFLGIDFDESVPDHSTISQLRRRKFGGTTLFQDIFDEIVRKCMAAGLVSGKLLLTDSTHILANAAKEKREIIEVPDTPSEYVKKLDREAVEAGLLDEPVTYPEKTKTVTKSTTDPESGLMNRPGKPNAFCYLNHQTSDAESGIITDVFVTPGNVNDCTPHTNRLETQIDKFGFETEAVCADAGYDNSEVYDAMLKRGIRTYIPKKKKPNNASSYAEGFEPEAFTYNPEEDAYRCPQGGSLAYSGYNKKAHKKRYQAVRKDCNNCPCRQQCIGDSKNSRMVERLLHEEARQEQAKYRNTPEYFAALRLRKIWCEGNFSHQKAEHNLRRTYKRGIERVTEQCLLSACVMNLIRLVKAAKRSFFIVLESFFKDYSALRSICQQRRNATPLWRHCYHKLYGLISKAPRKVQCRIPVRPCVVLRFLGRCWCYRLRTLQQLEKRNQSGHCGLTKALLESFHNFLKKGILLLPGFQIRGGLQLFFSGKVGIDGSNHSAVHRVVLLALHPPQMLPGLSVCFLFQV